MGVLCEKRELIGIGKPQFDFAFAALECRDCHEPSSPLYDQMTAALALQGEIHVP
jgi:hypothetical protein